jgi:NAD(P)-dependent dehydrogenase (short-subunit alcohol dehydrogenase family)
VSQRVLVTAAASGIGREIARAFYQGGAAVFVLHGHAGQPDGHLRQSIKGLVDPRDVAALAVFLASDSAKAISGQILPIDNDRQQAS